MEARKKFFMDCHLAGRKFHDADEVWDKLKVGTKLHMEHEPNNPHDANAVAVGYYDEEQGEMFRIGYIPKEDNETIVGFLEMGWTDMFECRISKINPDAHPEYQIHLTIKIVRRETNNK